MADRPGPERPAAGTAPDGEAGSALLLLPTGVLILLVLAALSFDLAVGFQRKRALLELADAAVNDAAGRGVDEGRLRADGGICLDDALVRRSLAGSLAVDELGAELVALRLLGPAGCPTGLTVTLRAGRPAPFTAAVPGIGAPEALLATATATLVTR